MLRGFLAGVLFVVLVLAIGGYAALRSGAVPANADARPPRIERWAARMSLGATLSRAPSLSDPLPASDANLLAGLKLYARDCAVCHGGASGTPTSVAKGLYQHPPQLAKDGVEDDPDAVTYWKVYHGIRWTGMPAFGHSLNQTQLWQITLFLKTMDHLPKAAQSVWEKVKA